MTATAAPFAREERGATIGYQPALDGVRAVSVTMVLLFHGGVSWMTGGYLGVSVFFTLSGFLITTLLLREFDARGHVRIGSFYARRARRLLPASVLCLAGVAAASRLGYFEGVAHLRRDLLGALLHVANWVQLLSGESYADVLQQQAGRRSPLDHYWSLAIEEQFYWVWPIAIGVLARRQPAARRRALLVATALAACVAPVTAWLFGADAAYWATPARGSEICAGAALAAVLHGRERVVTGRVPAWLAPACLAAITVLAVALPARGGLAYAGGLPLVAMLSTGLVLGLQRPGPGVTALSWTPLVALGRVSYGVYLYHWPLYVLLDERTTGWYGTRLLGLRVAATLLVATASYVVIERPVHRADWRPRRTAAAAVSLVGAGALALTVAAPEARTEFGPNPVAALTVAIPQVPPGQVLPELDVDRRTPSRPARILVLGDSTAIALGAGVVAWAAEDPSTAEVTVWAQPGCGFLRAGHPSVHVDQGTCDDWWRRIRELLGELQPDVVVLMTSGSDIIERSFEGPPRTAAEPEYRRQLAAAYREISGLLLGESTATIAWVRPPLLRPFWLDSSPLPASSWRAFDEVVDAVVGDLSAAHPGRLAIVDLRGYLQQQGLDGAREVRPDGIHLSEEAGLSIARDWLGPLLVDLGENGERGPTVGP